MSAISLTSPETATAERDFDQDSLLFFIIHLYIMSSIVYVQLFLIGIAL